MAPLVGSLKLLFINCITGTKYDTMVSWVRYIYWILLKRRLGRLPCFDHRTSAGQAHWPKKSWQFRAACLEYPCFVLCVLFYKSVERKWNSNIYWCCLVYRCLCQKGLGILDKAYCRQLSTQLKLMYVCVRACVRMRMCVCNSTCPRARHTPQADVLITTCATSPSEVNSEDNVHLFQVESPSLAWAAYGRSPSPLATPG